MAGTLLQTYAVIGHVEFFHTVEFYVIATVVAAAIVYLCTRPQSTRPVQTRFARAILEAETDAVGAEPSIEVTVRDDGMVMLTRHGLGHVRAGTVVALAITVKGFDVTLKERITGGAAAGDLYAELGDRTAPTRAEASNVSRSDIDYGGQAEAPVRTDMQATFALDFFAPEWYHICYTNEHTGHFSAFTLHVRAGIHTRRPFKQ